jgi:tetratricopeptide (TPR) repeat protein
LAGLGLDWDAPPAPDDGPRPPLRVEVDLGDLAPVRQRFALSRRAVRANPNNASACNELARVLVTGPDDLRDPSAALTLAENAVRLDPRREHLNTLGVVYYRLGRLGDAVATFDRASQAARGEGPTHDTFFLAMCHHRLGNRDQARTAYAEALEWMERHPSRQEELRRFRAEADAVMGR